MPTKDTRAQTVFEELLGKKFVESIKDSEWMGFSTGPRDIYGVERFEMDFYQKDGKNDTVSFLSFVYDADNKLFWTEDGISEDERFETAQAAFEHYANIENDILDNDFPFVDFPVALLK